ncbi:MAG: hypothetical protein MJE66_24415 [Proteobacteria bacterium]|nr:hypothetical protein [Pseudomonadota bacterium]
MPTARVKGTLLQALVESVQACLDNGKISSEELEVQVSAEALGLLEEKLQIIQWYPLEPYRELLDALWNLDGERRRSYMLRFGGDAAARLLEADTYRSFVDSAHGGGDRSLASLLKRTRVTVRLTDMLYDFVHVSVEHDEQRDRLQLLYESTEPFSEAMALATEGFLNQFTRSSVGSSLEGRMLEWQMERPSRHQLVYSLQLEPLLGEH